MKTSHKVLLVVLILIVVALLARYVVFKDKFNEWGAGLERVSDWQKDYRNKNPNATEAEVDAAFKAGIVDIAVWMEKYKQDHPGVTDADAKAAFNAAWGK
ncbi:MAG: hypothetical protein V4665_03090 [Patescibacteria group bacterium]